MPPLTPGVDEMDWPFISYDPTTYPPFPQPEPPRPALRYRLASFTARLICQTAAYICAFAAIYVLATGQI